MIRIEESEVAFAPTRVDAGRRRLPPAVGGAVIVALLGLALVKPWGNSTSPARSPAASGAPGVGWSTTAPSSTPPGSPLADSSPARDTLARALSVLPHPGAWGIGIAIHTDGASSARSPAWTAWVPLGSVWWRSASLIRALKPTGTDCAVTPTLKAMPFIVGITVPDAVATDFSVRGWLSRGPSTVPLDGDLVRLDSPGHSQVAELARADGKAWPDGAYELNLVVPEGVTTLGFCLA